MTKAEYRKFGRYRLVGTMADGAMARLFLSVMTGVDGFKRVVALKQVLPHLAQSPEFVQMFLNEARVASKLDHPSIVRIYEMGEIDGQYFISMEYLPAEDLTRILHRAHKEKKWIPITVAATIAQNVADALQCAHELQDDDGRSMGIVHRDVSLGNILVTYHGTVKLADFGIAKATALASEMSTRVGVFKGKYAYAAPEQVLGKEVDQRTDVFALGVVLWELLAIRRLFKRSNEAATIHAVEKAEVPPLRSIRPDVPPELEAITMKALAKKPRDRFQTAAEMSDALEGILGKVSAKSSSNLLKSWIVGLFGDERAELKRAIAQGRGFEPHPTDQDDIVLPPEKATLLGLKPLPDGARPQTGQHPPKRQTTSSLGRSRSLNVPTSTTSASRPPSALTADIIIPKNISPDSRDTTGITSVIPRAAWSIESAPAMTSTQELSFDPDSTWGSGSHSQSLVRPPPPPQRSLRNSIIAGTAAALLIVIVSIGILLHQRGIAGGKVGDIAVTSDPAEASISVEGIPTGLVTPAVIHDLPTDHEVAIKLEKEGYQPYDLNVQLSSGARAERSVELERLAYVRFGRVPSGAVLVIDGRTFDPKEPAELTSGSHRVSIERNGEVLWTETIVIKKGGNQTMDLKQP
jgi:serine/threonine protein kinase